MPASTLDQESVIDMSNVFSSESQLRNVRALFIVAIVPSTCEDMLVTIQCILLHDSRRIRHIRNSQLCLRLRCDIQWESKGMLGNRQNYDSMAVLMFPMMATSNKSRFISPSKRIWSSKGFTFRMTANLQPSSSSYSCCCQFDPNVERRS